MGNGVGVWDVWMGGREGEGGGEIIIGMCVCVGG